jgi:two-component system, cell cycle sensor histidine kinase and response regulator CckA
VADSFPDRRSLRSALPNDAFVRFFEGLAEGVYIGLIAPTETATLAANPHLATIFGWPIDTPTADVRPFDRDRFVDDQARSLFVERLSRDQTVSDYALRLRRWDGTAIWVEVTARADPLPSGSVLRIEATVRDVTDRRNIEDRARDLHAELAQSEKLASLGQTMSGVAHELNNPLATILACAERLTTQRLDEPTRRDLQSIHNAAERAARIVRNLQTFARKRHSTRTTVDLNQVVRETLAGRADAHRTASITVLDALEPGLPEVFVDTHQIQQILLNLIINAEQAMREAHGQGTLTLRSWLDNEREAVMLEVRDDGPGVPEAVRAKVFDPFFTTKSAGKGTGLGLTVAYAIAQEHGGTISVAEHEGPGAAFLLGLPVGGLGLRRIEPLPQKVLPIVPKGTRALVIEDETALGDAVAAALADEGFRPDRAEDGAEALKKVAERHYDVIICDLKMPKVDGMSFFREVSAKTPLIGRRLIFVTGDVAGTDAERFLEESGCRWIPKPFRLKELVQLARETLR